MGISKPYDDGLKKLVEASPAAFIALVLGFKAFFKNHLPYKLQAWELEVDGLLHIILENGEEMLLHLEFQTYNDVTMAERLLRYNVLIRSQYHLPVFSCVIYLVKDGDIPTSPLEWTVPSGQEVLKFSFGSIELADLPMEVLLQLDELGLLPLAPLTKDGGKREVVEKMIITLQVRNKTELIPILGTLASLRFKRENATADEAWLERKMNEMRDILRESPYYQSILKEGLEEGHEKGLKEGLEKGKIQGLRQAVLNIVGARFPKILRFTKGQVTVIDDADILSDLIFKMSTAQTPQEAKEYLLALNLEEDEGQDNNPN